MPYFSLSEDFISIDAMYHAYRKAKVDVCCERNQPKTMDFVEYEKDLHSNLVKLRDALLKKKSSWFQEIGFIGEYGCIPKSMKVESKRELDLERPHFSISDPDASWKNLTSNNNATVTVDFRPIALFTVDMYVVCALWVNLVGHMFDGCLSSHARGSRVRRLRRKIEGTEVGEYHVQALGTFPPYYHAYKQWRDDGLKAIRKELAEDKPVIAITMDLTSFYHNIDAEFLTDKSFLKVIDFEGTYNRLPNRDETTFTNQLVHSFSIWANSIPGHPVEGPIGIPVGPSAPRIIANVLLCDFDRMVAENLDPIYYSRYVDDIFLVIRDTGKFKSGEDVFKRLGKLLEPSLIVEPHALSLNLDYAKNSKLQFQSAKQRIFALDGEVGQDLLDTIEDKIGEISSEWRLLPDLDELEKSPAARVLSSNRSVNEDANTLRKADKLSLNRLSFSILLRHYDQLEHDLPPSEWKKERFGFYRFAEKHVLTPASILDLSDYISRLTALAVACRDWSKAKGIVRKVRAALKSIELAEGSKEKYKQQLWSAYRKTLSLSLRIAVESSYPIEDPRIGDERPGTELLGMIDDLGGMFSIDDRTMQKRSSEYFWSDLGRVSFKYGLLGTHTLPKFPFPAWKEGLSESEAHRLETIKGFIEIVSKNTDMQIKARPLLFPTRPFSVAEITEADPSCVTNMDRLQKLAWALRGTWIKSQPSSDLASDIPPDIVTIGTKEWKREPRIAVTSYATTDESWARAAAGAPNLTSQRYKALVKLTNSLLQSTNRPDYVLFPELSIPRRWLPSLAKKLLASRISLIAGVEYKRRLECLPGALAESIPTKEVVVNEAIMYLTDDRMGHFGQCVVKQQKGLPAHHEKDELRKKFGIELATFDSCACDKRVYRHFGHHFGLLICSELTDIRFREQMRGRIDSLFILSWNQDLESFASLVDSASLDVHCFISLVNNRRFGDSRVRAPYKKQWMRDLVRVKGGVEDFFVVTQLDLTTLRQFQSHHEPPIGIDEPFKPFPEGFEITPTRRQIPGDPK